MAVSDEDLRSVWLELVGEGTLLLLCYHGVSVASHILFAQRERESGGGQWGGIYLGAGGSE